MIAHLHGFFRSSASWRVRIALALKGIDHAQSTYKLRAGEQRREAFLRLNPQGLVPALEIDGAVLTQSLAIIEYLDETVAEPPLCGTTSLERARIRAFALAIACETHPLQNLRVLNRTAPLRLQLCGPGPRNPSIGFRSSASGRAAPVASRDCGPKRSLVRRRVTRLLWYYRKLEAFFSRRRPGPLATELKRAVEEMHRFAD